MVITDDHPASTTETDLLRRARAGETRAFCLLIEPLQTRLLRQATALAGDASAAEDLVSETLVEAWKSLPRYQGTCRISTWLYAILLHRYHKSVRRARSRPVSLASLPFAETQKLHDRHEHIAAAGASPAEAAAQHELFTALRACIGNLPAKHRKVVLLRFFEDASLPDMATVLGCSVGTAKSRLYHALEKLRKMKMNLPIEKGDKRI
jgi:RNA polymerase sigma-70 factor (ECF subfamily)